MNFNIFAEEELRGYLEHKAHAVLTEIEKETNDYLLNVNEDDYVRHKTALMLVEEVVIHVEHVYASSSERMIPASAFPSDFPCSRSGGSYKKNVITFHFPVSGNFQLLRTMPTRRSFWTMPVDFENAEILIDVINFRDDAGVISGAKDQHISSILAQLERVNEEVRQFNLQVDSRVRSAVQARKDHILKQTGVLAALGVPIKKSANTPETFSVPLPQARKKIVVSKPKVHDTGFNPEPTIEISVYMDILQMIHDVGRQFERHPSIYKGKEEEHLRDHILMVLEPNFIGSATGETFNKSGKTDILLRHEGSNVFIAECKFWKGARSLENAVSQLLSYLTWRDSKAAAVIFVENKDFTNVLKAASSAIERHPNYLKLAHTVDETWSIYNVHLDGDRNRVVSLAVMLYHLPG
jgi:hypothetical protein